VLPVPTLGELFNVPGRKAKGRPARARQKCTSKVVELPTLRVPNVILSGQRTLSSNSGFSYAVTWPAMS